MPLPLTATQSPLVSRRLDGVFDWGQTLSGAALAAFLWGHLFLVGGILFGADVMNAAAGLFERTYLIRAGGPAIGLLLLAHFLLTARKLPLRIESQRTLLRHARMLRHADTWLWIVQAATGALILVLGGLHVWTVLADAPIAVVKSAARVRGGVWLAVYLLLLPAAEIHASVGVYRIAVKWGLLKRAGRRTYKDRAIVLTLALVAVGLAILARLWFLAPQAV